MSWSTPTEHDGHAVLFAVAELLKKLRYKVNVCKSIVSQAYGKGRVGDTLHKHEHRN